MCCRQQSAADRRYRVAILALAGGGHKSAMEVESVLNDKCPSLMAWLVISIGIKEALLCGQYRCFAKY